MRQARLSLICLLSLCFIVLVSGCGSTTVTTGGGTGSGTFVLNAESSLTIAQGQTRTFTVTPASANGFKGSIQVSMTGLPTGVTMAPANATVATGSSTTFTLTAASDAAVGTTTVKVIRRIGHVEREHSGCVDGDGSGTAGDHGLYAYRVAGHGDDGARRDRAGDVEQRRNRWLQRHHCRGGEWFADGRDGVSFDDLGNAGEPRDDHVDGGGRRSGNGIAGAGELCWNLGRVVAHG